MYCKKFVAVVKVGGRILREFNNSSISELESESSLLLPFGTEYSLMFKNLESRPARLRVWVDGQDVLSGYGILIAPGGSSELEGFMDARGRVTNRFKFIQKTEQIVEHRGDRIDDGMIRVEFQYEKAKAIHVDVIENHQQHHHHYNDWPCWPRPWHPYPPPSPWITYGSNTAQQPSSRGSLACNASVGSPKAELMACAGSGPVAECCAPRQDEGITVPGSVSGQQFGTGHIGQLEENAHVMVIRLRGTTKSDAVVTAPVEVKTKVLCPTCGCAVKSNNKYCPNCGTCVIEV